MAEADSYGMFEKAKEQIMRCARRRPSEKLLVAEQCSGVNAKPTQAKQLPTVLGNRQGFAQPRKGKMDWAELQELDTDSPSSTSEPCPEPSPVHDGTASPEPEREAPRRPCFRKPSKEVRTRQLQEEARQFCDLSFDEVDPFQQQGLTCRMLAFLKSMSRVLSWEDGGCRGESPAYEILGLSEVDVHMFKVLCARAEELIENHRFRQAYEQLCRVRPRLGGEAVSPPAREVAARKSCPQGQTAQPTSQPKVSQPQPKPTQVDAKKGAGKGGKRGGGGGGTGGGKYLCRVKVGIEEDSAFQVCRRIIGPGGENMKRIIEATGSDGSVKIRLRGRGSKYLEGPEHKESTDELMLCISATNRRSFEKAASHVEGLIRSVQQDYAAFCQSRGLPLPLLDVKREAQRSR